MPLVLRALVLFSILLSAHALDSHVVMCQPLDWAGPSQAVSCVVPVRPTSLSSIRGVQNRPDDLIFTQPYNRIRFKNEFIIM